METRNQQPEIERRSFPVAELRVEQSEGQAPKIRGYAAVFGQRSEDLGGFVEQIAPGAFRGSIAKDDIRALWNHNSDVVLGRNLAGTLRLTEDERGLSVEIDPPDTQAARDAMTLIRRGDVSQMSFGFFTSRDQWNESKGEVPLRTLMEVRLFDVSPVAFPAYPQTSVAVRSMGVWRAQEVAGDVPEAEAVSVVVPAAGLDLAQAWQRQREAE